MSWEQMGRGVDEYLIKWRQEGMNGSPEDREKFLKEVFHGARGTMRVGLFAAASMNPGKSPKELFDAAVPKMLEMTRKQAADSGFDEEQTELYIETQRQAYKSLAEELGFDFP